jgi:hypothetical protein
MTSFSGVADSPSSFSSSRQTLPKINRKGTDEVQRSSGRFGYQLPMLNRDSETIAVSVNSAHNPLSDDEHYQSSQSSDPDFICKPCKNADVLKTKATTVRVLISILMGIIFGFVFARSRVFEPLVIRGQFTLTNFAMMKMFLAAMGTSALIFAAVQV